MKDTLIDLAHKILPPEVCKHIVEGLERSQKNKEMLDDLREMMGLPTSTEIARMKARSRLNTTMDYDVLEYDDAFNEEETEE